VEGCTVYFSFFAGGRKQMIKTIQLQRNFGARTRLYRRLGISRATVFAALGVSAAISILAGALALPSQMMADDDQARTFTVDVGFRNLFYQNNVDPTKDPATMAQGDTFLQYGTIFPGGTIPEGQTTFDPDTASGAIGVYVARGTWMTDSEGFAKAARREKDAESDLAFMTELFSFNDNRGTIMTDGIMPNAYFSAHRVLLGGTRAFSDIVGEVREENIGERIPGGYCNLRITFKMRKAGEGHRR
jgi:hypothetical protein